MEKKVYKNIGEYLDDYLNQDIQTLLSNIGDNFANPLVDSRDILMERNFSVNSWDAYDAYDSFLNEKKIQAFKELGLLSKEHQKRVNLFNNVKDSLLKSEEYKSLIVRLKADYDIGASLYENLKNKNNKNSNTKIKDLEDKDYDVFIGYLNNKDNDVFEKIDSAFIKENIDLYEKLSKEIKDLKGGTTINSANELKIVSQTTVEKQEIDELVNKVLTFVADSIKKTRAGTEIKVNVARNFKDIISGIIPNVLYENKAYSIINSQRFVDKEVKTPDFLYNEFNVAEKGSKLKDKLVSFISIQKFIDFEDIPIEEITKKFIKDGKPERILPVFSVFSQGSNVTRTEHLKIVATILLDSNVNLDMSKSSFKEIGSLINSNIEDIKEQRRKQKFKFDFENGIDNFECSTTESKTFNFKYSSIKDMLDNISVYLRTSEYYTFDNATLNIDSENVIFTVMGESSKDITPREAFVCILEIAKVLHSREHNQEILSNNLIHELLLTQKFKKQQSGSEQKQTIGRRKV